MLNSILNGLRSLFSRGKKADLPGLEDRRQQVRLSCHYEVEAKSGSETFPCTVLDIGPRGARLETLRKLEVGQILKVSYRPGGIPVGRQRLNCEVVWTKEGVAGVKFVDTDDNVRHSWALHLLSELGLDERAARRRAMRVDCELPTVLYLVDQGEESLNGQILNIGAGGALLRIARPLEENARLRMDIGPYSTFPTLQLFGRVLRCRTQTGQEGWLHSVRFLNQDGPQVELLGKYVLGLLREATS